MMNMKIESIVELSDSFQEIKNAIDTPFYRVFFDVAKVIYDPIQRSFPPCIEDIKHIYAQRKFIEKSRDFVDNIETITLNDAWQKILTFSSYKGDPSTPDILEEQDSEWCHENFEAIMTILITELQTSSPLCFEILANQKSYFHPAAAWGCCLIFVNEKEHSMVLAFLDGIF